MKTLTILSFCALFSLSACHVDSAKVVENEKQTLECVVGTWVPENADEKMSHITFQAPSAVGEKSGTVTTSAVAEPMTGTWQYQDVGEIELTHTDGISHFKLLNCNRGIVDGLTIYKKE